MSSSIIPQHMVKDTSKDTPKDIPKDLPKAICFQPFFNKMAPNYHVCFAGANPKAHGLQESESTTRALAENPRSGSLTVPIGIGLGPMVPPSPAPSLVMYMGKFWSPGRELKISFLSGTDWQKNKVKQYAPTWCQYANILMTFVDSGPRDILIDFDPTVGSWSYYGTDSGYFAAKGTASMNLGWINQDQPEENISQVVLHEFGHALGAIHEHESPFASIPWNKERVYKDLGGPPNNWNREQVDHNMFSLYSLDVAEATKFDRSSIMLYHYPAEWTLNGQATPFNTTLSDGDKSYIRFVYPPDSLDAGQFSTLELRPWNQPTLTNTKLKYLWKKYPTAPRLPLGLTLLDVDKNQNIRINASTSDITRESFNASLNAWADTTLYAASLTYIEAGPAFDYLQTGTFNTQEVGAWQNHAPQNSKRINFATAFQGQPPKIVCWLTSIDMDRNHNWRCRTYATDVDTAGFTVHIDTWADTIMYAASMTWIAYPADQPNVASGSFSTNDIRTWSYPQHENSATVSFSKGFNKVPKLAMALDGLDYDRSANLRVRLSTSAVTPTAMTWHLQSWADSTMYMASASYFAWA